MIRLFYYQNMNLGDELSRYIVEKLSGGSVIYCNPYSFKKYVRNHLSAVKQLLSGHIDRIPTLLAFSRKNVLIAVGSLIEHSTSRCVVWGTGMAQTQLIPVGGDFLITRGYQSKNLLEKYGYKVKSSLAGDPALLMPIIFHPCVGKVKGRIGIIPHVSEYVELANLFRDNDKFELIDFRTKEVEKTLQTLLSCERIYSSSLHGIILSHAYGIDCIRFKNNVLGGGDFKFKDYLSSVEIPYYEPLTVDDVMKEIQPSYIMTKPKKEVVVKIQKELLRLAPFPVKPDFQE